MDISSILIATAQATEEAVVHATTTQSPVAMFGLSWKLFLAQLVNFGIVLLVLWKWVLGPIAKRLSDRQQQVEQALKTVEDTETAKEAFELWKREQMITARTEASKIIENSKKEAEQVKLNVLTATKEEQDLYRKQTESQIQLALKQALGEAQGELSSLAVQIAEKILRAKLDSKTDHQLVEESLKRVITK